MLWPDVLPKTGLCKDVDTTVLHSSLHITLYLFRCPAAWMDLVSSWGAPAGLNN